MALSFVIKEPININWNDFSIESPKNFNGTCYIYVDSSTTDVQSDMQKLSQIKNIGGLETIVISSNDFRIAQYFDVLMKDCECKKNFDLLNDFEIKNRNEIDFSALHYNEVTIPFDYLMYGISTNGINSYNLINLKRENIISVDSNQQKNYPDLINKVNDIVDEIFGELPIEQLDDIDKSVLVSNWIQKKVQFIEGKVSRVGNKRFVCDDFNASNDKEDIMTIINESFGVCNGIAKLSVALLTHPKIQCQCNMAFSPGHAYFTQSIDGKLYVVDNTWCITRNPNHIDGSLKSGSFSDEYLLIGKDKINENETTLSYHTRTGIFSGTIAEQGIPRERIKQSIDKLKALGIEFDYTEPPIFIQHEESKDKTYE